MNKVKIIFISVFLSMSIFCIFKLNSFALSPITPQNIGFTNGSCRYDQNYSGYPCVWGRVFSENSAYNRSGLCVYYIETYNGNQEQWMLVDVYDLVNNIENNQEPFATMDFTVTRIEDDYKYIKSLNNSLFTENTSDYAGYPFSMYTGTIFTTDFPVFETREKAIDYFRYGLLDDESIRYGENYLEESKVVEWEDGNPYYGSYSDDIPAPKWNVTGSQSGNISKTITFINAEYDPRSQNGRYGLVLSLKWGSIDEFVLNRDGGLFSKNYKVYYNSQLNYGNMVDVYLAPTRVGDIQYCPQSFMFAQNEISVNAFNTYLQNNPVANRDITVPSDMADTALLQTFQNYLAKPNCPYNTLIFTCCYYKKMDNGNYAFGPYSTGIFNPPSQGALFNVGTLSSTDQGNMTDGNGGGSSGSSENGSWEQSWGNNTPDINYGQNVDPQELINNVQGLFGFVGQMPSFVAQLISFLPDWILSFIAVALGLAIAIGIVKLFIG